MINEQKPDNVVFNVDGQEYDAALKPYATNLGAPVITTNDTLAWKNRSVNKINHKLQSKFLKLKVQYAKMLKLFEDNKLILNANISFEPIIGKVYHLYQRANGQNFLSIIDPDQCNFKLLGSFYLNDDHSWERL